MFKSFEEEVADIISSMLIIDIQEAQKVASWVAIAREEWNAKEEIRCMIPEQ